MLKQVTVPFLSATLAVPDDGNPSVQLGEGDGRIFLTAEAGGLAAIVVRDGSGKERVRIRVDAEGGADVETIGADGDPKP